MGDQIAESGSLHLTGLAVIPDRWGQGIGKALLGAAVAQASAKRAERVTLWTHSTNERAISLFASAGLEATGRQRADDLGALLIHYKLVLPKREAAEGRLCPSLTTSSRVDASKPVSSSRILATRC